MRRSDGSIMLVHGLCIVLFVVGIAVGVIVAVSGSIVTGVVIAVVCWAVASILALINLGTGFAE